MKLYFIRHGKASFDAPSDDARTLTNVGIQQAKNNGKLLKSMGIIPAKIYVSPRLRAQQTAQHIGEAVDCIPETNEACNFDFSTEKALDLVSKHQAGDDIVFVGHNPSMSQVATDLTGTFVEMKPCAIACIAIVNYGNSPQAMLQWFIKPKLISALLD